MTILLANLLQLYERDCVIKYRPGGDIKYKQSTGGLTNPRPWRGGCRAGYSNTGGPPLPRKRAPSSKMYKQCKVSGLNLNLFFSREIGSLKYHIFAKYHGKKFLLGVSFYMWLLLGKMMSPVKLLNVTIILRMSTSQTICNKLKLTKSKAQSKIKDPHQNEWDKKQQSQFYINWYIPEIDYK